MNLSKVYVFKCYLREANETNCMNLFTEMLEIGFFSNIVIKLSLKLSFSII